MPKKFRRSSTRSSLNSLASPVPGSQRRRNSPSFVVWFGVAAGVILLLFVNSALSFSKDHPSKLDAPSVPEIKEESHRAVSGELEGRNPSSVEWDDECKAGGVCEWSRPDLEAGSQETQGVKLIDGGNAGNPNEADLKATDAELSSEGDQFLAPAPLGSYLSAPVHDGYGNNMLQSLDAREYREHGAGLLLKGASGGGSPRVCLADELSAANCGQEGDIILPRCLVAVPVASKDVLPCLEDLLPVDRGCGGEEVESDVVRALDSPVVGTSDTVMYCFHNPISCKSTCGSICNGEKGTLDTGIRVCLCGAGLMQFLVHEPQFLKDTEDWSNVAGSNAQGEDGRIGPADKMEEGDEVSSSTKSVTVIAVDDTSDATDLNMKPEGDVLENFQTLVDVSRLGSLVPGETENLAPESPGQTDVVKPVMGLVGLDEFKKSHLEKQQQVQTNNGNASGTTGQVIRRTSEDYNFAAGAHGAKIVASSKEAKGANHILEKDKDKYLRIPCNVEDKFVVIRLSAETQVDTFVISNFEFYASNLKDFELLGSKVYPTEDWTLLGKFQAQNVRHPQTFDVTDSRLVRFVKLRMLTHYGSDFYCTLSMVEVRGVDEIESLLEGWIPIREPENGVKSQPSGSSPQEDSAGAVGPIQNPSPNVATAMLSHPTAPNSLQVSTPGEGSDAVSQNAEKLVKGSSTGENLVTGPIETGAGSVAAPSLLETVHVHSRPTGEAALKIVMQKVKSLELNQSLFDQYVEDLNEKIKDTFHSFGQELILLTEKLRNETATSANLANRLRDLVLES